MGIPVSKARVSAPIFVKQHLLGRKRYPLVLMLEPLFRCNLACAGCGKIDYPDKILNQRLPYEDCMEAIDECGAPVVVIAGGEPLLHKDIGKIVRGRARSRQICHALHQRLAAGKEDGRIHPQLAPSISRSISMATARCTTSRCARRASTTAPSPPSRPPVAKGFHVTINCTLFNDADPERVANFLDTLEGHGRRQRHRVARLRL